MLAKTSYGGGLKLAVWKQQAEKKNLSTVWLKQRKMGRRRLKKEKRERKRFEKLEQLRNCAVHRRIFQILKPWTTGQTICRNYKEIIDYLVYGSCKFFQREDMKCFKQLKAFQFFKDGHVQKIELSLISNAFQNILRFSKIAFLNKNH